MTRSTLLNTYFLMPHHEGDCLKELAKTYKGGAKALAKDLNISRQWLYHYLGKETLEEGFKQKVADLVGLPVNEAFTIVELDSVNDTWEKRYSDLLRQYLDERQVTITILKEVRAVAAALQNLGEIVLTYDDRSEAQLAWIASKFEALTGQRAEALLEEVRTIERQASGQQSPGKSAGKDRNHTSKA